METLLQIIGILILSYILKQWFNQINSGYHFLLDEIDEIKNTTSRTEEYIYQLLQTKQTLNIKIVPDSDNLPSKD